MVDAPELKRLALALPEAADASTADALVFEVAGKGFAWTWMERTAPKVKRRPRLDVLAVRCPIETKEVLIAAAPGRFFDEDHYRGYPAVLVRLAAIQADELGDLLAVAWKMTAPVEIGGLASPKRRRPARPVRPNGEPD